MESVAKGLVGMDVILTMRKLPNFPTFQNRVKILKVKNGIMEVRTQSGMVKSMALEDEYMRVEGIAAILPETRGA